MKKSLLLTLLAALIFAACFILYFQYFSRHNADLWDYVPANTVAVYETNDPVGNWNSFVETSIWKSIQHVESFNTINRAFTVFDSLLGSNGTLDKVLRGRRMLVSTHMISQQNYDYLFYLDLPSNSTEALQLANYFAAEIGKSERLYEGVIITEIGKGENRFSYIVYEGVFIGGFTAYLVEDVIRNEQDRFQQGFKIEHADAFRVPAIEGDLGNLYINHKEFEGQLGAVIGDAASASIIIGALADATFLDISAQEDHMLLSGFSVGAKSDTFLLHSIDDQRAGDFRIKQLIPEATAFLLQYSFSDLADLQNRQSHFLKLHAISSSVKSTASEVLDHISDEVALATLESVNVDSPDKILFLRTDNSSALLDLFDQRSSEINLQKGDTMYFEYYYDHRIARLNMKEFPASVLGPLFEGFDQSFYLTFQNYLVIGNNMQAITRFLDDIENDNTWGKRLRINNFLENVVVESNVSLIINTPEHGV